MVQKTARLLIAASVLPEKWQFRSDKRRAED